MTIEHRNGNAVALFATEENGPGKMKKITKQERDDAILFLDEIIEAGDTIYTIIKAVSSSGMSRQIAMLVRTDTGIRNISWLVSRALGYRYNRDKNCISVSGCGMDMGFEVVYNLSALLFKGTTDKDPGYLLKQSWL